MNWNQPKGARFPILAHADFCYLLCTTNLLHVIKFTTLSCYFVHVCRTSIEHIAYNGWKCDSRVKKKTGHIYEYTPTHTHTHIEETRKKRTNKQQRKTLPQRKSKGFCLVCKYFFRFAWRILISYAMASHWASWMDAAISPAIQYYTVCLLCSSIEACFCAEGFIVCIGTHIHTLTIMLIMLPFV